MTAKKPEKKTPNILSLIKGGWTKKKMGNRKYFDVLLKGGLGILILGFMGCGNGKEEGEAGKLPFYGKSRMEGPSGKSDTLRHRVPSFTLKDQNGDPFNEKELDPITVVDFFFTSCPTICPKLTKNLHTLQKRLDKKGWSEVGILSITVDPEHDSPAVLRKYIRDKGVDTGRWTFLTGKRETIYELGREGFMVSARKDSGAPGGYLHSGRFILLDRKRRIRGFYDGTKAGSLDELMADIETLRDSSVP